MFFLVADPLWIIEFVADHPHHDPVAVLLSGVPTGIDLRQRRPIRPSSVSRPTCTFLDRSDAIDVWVRTRAGEVADVLTLGNAVKLAKTSLGNSFVAWWCDPTIDLDLHTPPATFGNAWPSEVDKLQVDEVAFYAEYAVWRAVRTSNGPRFVLIEELTSKANDAKQARAVHTPARLHGFQRFSSENTGQGNVLLREWHDGDEILGFTLTKEQR